MIKINRRKILKEFLRIGVSLAFVAGSVYFLRGRWMHALEALSQINVSLFAFIFLLFIFLNVLVALRLSIIIRAEKMKVSTGRVVYMSFVALFFNLFLPSSLGGDAVKAYYLGKDAGSTMKAISAIFVDRLVGLTTLMAVAFVSLPFFVIRFSNYQLPIVVAVIFSAFLFIIILFLNENLARKFKFISYLIPSEIGKQKLGQLYQAISQYRHSRTALFSGFLISIAVQMISIYMGYLIFKSLSVEIPFLVLFLVLPVTGIASMAPSLGGLGVREAALIYFISQYTTTAHAVAFALANDILIYGLGLVCGILYAVFGGRIRREPLKTYD